MPATEVLVMGAGPYGLSISTHLRARGIDHLIVGRPMDTWRTHMPAGMYMRTWAYGVDMSSPQAGYDVAGYCRSERIGDIDPGLPLSIERFLDYADWYVKQLVPDVSDVTVTEIEAVNGGFRVQFAEADPVVARNLVIATGLLPHVHVPAELSGLPSGHVSHTSDHRRFDHFRGRRVAVVGAGSSALETAAMLHEAGAEVQLVVRANGPVWAPRGNPLNARARLGSSKLCGGWKCQVWSSPAAFRRLPQGVRVVKARTVLGPVGSWWLKDRVEGVIEIVGNTHVRGAEPKGSGVRLLLDGPSRSSLEVDHAIVGTGYRINVARLSYLPEELRARIATVGGYPVLTRAGESTVPGLYFAGAAAAFALGPSLRFISGTHNMAAQLARSVARATNQRRDAMTP